MNKRRTQILAKKEYWPGFRQRKAAAVDAYILVKRKQRMCLSAVVIVKVAEIIKVLSVKYLEQRRLFEMNLRGKIMHIVLANRWIRMRK